MFASARRHPWKIWCGHQGLIFPLLVLICCILFIYWSTLEQKLLVELVEDSPAESTGCKYSQDEIDSYVFNNPSLAMDDTQLLDYLRSCVLHPPDGTPYNLSNPSADPSAKEGVNRIVLKLLNNKTGGVFLEAGANDGESISNTLLLERNFGWTGLLVEPDATAFERLKMKHRKAWMAGACLSTTKVPQKLRFLKAKRSTTINTERSRLSSLRKWEADKVRMEEVVVNCFPLYSLLLASNMPTIDYLSLDIEGAELDVIKTIPFHKLKIRVMSVENIHIRKIPGAESETMGLLQRNGYRVVEKVRRGSANDYIFAHRDVR